MCYQFIGIKKNRIMCINSYHLRFVWSLSNSATGILMFKTRYPVQIFFLKIWKSCFRDALSSSIVPWCWNLCSFLEFLAIGHVLLTFDIFVHMIWSCYNLAEYFPVLHSNCLHVPWCKIKPQILHYIFTLWNAQNPPKQYQSKLPVHPLNLFRQLGFSLK